MASLCKISTPRPVSCQAHVPTLRAPSSKRCLVPVRSLGKDAVDGFFDMAKLVGGFQGNKTPYDELASAIGRDVYVDLAGWHLYLRDMNAGPGVKMSQVLANQFGPDASRGLKEADIEAVLKKVPVKLGQGRRTLPLYELVPSMCVAELTEIVEEFGRKR
uniref:Uncharacterized protein n=1 Tax=Chlamydomonas leiostraca TaxID=1034604 RepID=A0A7S0RMK7_9CHLO